MIQNFRVNYCDDIRHEIGNKVSLIGLYGADLLVPEVPTVIPKLCAFVQIASEIGKVFDDEIEIRTTLDDNVLATTKLPKGGSAESIGKDEFQTANLQIIMSPFPIEKACVLRIRAYYRGAEFRSAALRIACAPVDQSSSEPQ